jgi:hypothetical protein
MIIRRIHRNSTGTKRKNITVWKLAVDAVDMLPSRDTIFSLIEIMKDLIDDLPWPNGMTT